MSPPHWSEKPHGVIIFYTNWTYKGRYGVWSAFLALLVRLFFHIPSMFSYTSYAHEI